MSTLSRRTRIIAALIGGALIASVVIGVQYLSRPHDMPDIQGALMQQPRQLPQFRLTDHRGQAFTNADLKGRWHMLSYGFTHCPDICPLTLNVLAQMKNRLSERQRFTDLGLLFYSVDPKRDTPERLAEYVSYYHPTIVGLTSTDAPEETPGAFENGLGIVHSIPKKQRGKEDYIVNHGVKIFLLNPDGHLQAIFEPDVRDSGKLYFQADKLLKDYMAVRRYLEQ